MMLTNKSCALLFLLFLNPSLSAFASDSFCDDPVAYVCDGKNEALDKQQNLFAQRLSRKALLETQNFFKSEKSSLRGFFASIHNGLINSKNKSDFSFHVSRGITYLSCLDYLARSAYSSTQQELSPQHSCFSKTARYSNVEDLSRRLLKLSDLKLNQSVLNSFLDFKSLVLKVVNESSYGRQLKPILLEQVNSTYMLSIHQLLSLLVDEVYLSWKADTKKSDVINAIQDAFSQCDPTGESRNAFNMALPDSKNFLNNYMVICPSMWIHATQTHFLRADELSGSKPAMAEFARDATYVRPRDPGIFHYDQIPELIAPVVMHELGHSVDILLRVGYENVQKMDKNQFMSNLEFNQGVLSVVEGFNACMLKRHFSKGTLAIEGPLADIYHLMYSKEAAAMLYFGEYHADSVAANGLSLYVNRFDRLKQRREAMKSGLSLFCGQKEHDEFSPTSRSLHPSGEFRIKTTFLGNLNLRHALGCHAAKETACSLR